MNTIYLIVGCPGSGKSWVCEQLTDSFEYIDHDLYIGMNEAYHEAIVEAAEKGRYSVLTEAPFSISQIKDPLEAAGLTVIPVFIIEEHDVIAERYRNREGKEIPKGHLTRQETYRQRAEEWEAFMGTSEEVLEHLREII